MSLADHLEVEPSDAERAEWPETTRRYVESLEGLLTHPVTAEFLAGVEAEAAHQQIRWGEAHDRSKSAENWYWLIGFLAGKALRAHVTGDREKAMHHTISSAAALSQWYAAIRRDESGQGLGEDLDLNSLAGGDQ